MRTSVSWTPKVGDTVRLRCAPFGGLIVGQVCKVTRVNDRNHFSVAEVDEQFPDTFQCGSIYWGKIGD